MDATTRARLIAQHTQYAYKLASATHRAVRLSLQDRQDLAQEAVVGLILAVDDFDPSILPLKNFRFYARRRILGHVKDLLASILLVRDNEQTIGLAMPESVEPVERAAATDDVWDAIRRLSPFEQYLVIADSGVDGRPRQSTRYISEECGLSPARIRSVLEQAYSRMAEGMARRRA